jgi:hypothetical protein
MLLCFTVDCPKIEKRNSYKKGVTFVLNGTNIFERIYNDIQTQGERIVSIYIY